MLNHFVGRSQMSCIRSLSAGEEGRFFLDKLAELNLLVGTMPKTYETDGQGMNAVAYLHYFRGGSDWYITERDCETEQEQAFGFVVLNGWIDDAELGYISIVELLQYGVELDLFWEPKTLAEIKLEYRRAA